MIKKIFIAFILLFSLFNFSYSNATCKYEDWMLPWTFLDWCKPSTLVTTSDMKVEWWFKTILNKWIKSISTILWVLAVGCLVYAGFLMQFSAWEDEQIKKWKNIVKWTLIWVMLLISASGIIYLVIKLVFWLWN